MYLSVHLSICPYVSICLSVFVSVCVSFFLPTDRSICLSVHIYMHRRSYCFPFASFEMCSIYFSPCLVSADGLQKSTCHSIACFVNGIDMHFFQLHSPNQITTVFPLRYIASGAAYDLSVVITYMMPC